MNDSSPTSGPRFTILSVAHALMTVGCGSAGGSEEILRLLDRDITRGGFRSIVIAGSGSKIAGELVPTLAMNGDLSDDTRAAAQRLQRKTIESVLATRHVDLIHFHGLDFLSYRPADCPVPQLATLHLPVSWYPPDLFKQPNLTVNFVSEAQANSAPNEAEKYVIPNGIDLESLYVSQEKDDFLLWLGRVCPEKAPHIALRVAHRMRLPLVVAGPLHPFPSHLDYYRQEVEPLLDEQRRYIGPVNGQAKSDLLSKAACLLVPSLVAETSCLVAMEAIASGTPVVCFPSGALPEVVQEGVTGFLVGCEDEMLQAVPRTKELVPLQCRRIAEERFSCSRMTEQYLQLYKTITKRTPVAVR